MIKPTTIDFETQGIKKRPFYPPVPVGVSIKHWGKSAKYYAWGHINGKNNCTFNQAKAELAKAYKNHDGVIFQNGKFDIDVANVHFGLEAPDPLNIHDTMFLLYLDNPHATSLSLKPSAARLFNLPPDEQEEVRDWLIENQPVPGIKIGKANYGEFICFAPAELVGKYANGDTERTERIFKLLYEKTIKRGMLAAYQREQWLMPILLENEAQGIRVDLKRLRSDVTMYQAVQIKLHAWICKRLKVPEDINLNSDAQLYEALTNAGKLNDEALLTTEKGNASMSKESLNGAMTDRVLYSALKYRTELKTCLSTFMEPWLEVAAYSGGLIHTNWNQVKSTDGGAIGTRTGRLSSTPNFQNLPNEFESIWAHEKKGLPKAPFELPLLPRVRGYVIPMEKDHVIIDRDYSQQEPRILAHFEGGALMDRYLTDNWTDMHDFAKAELERVGKFYDRKPVKNTNLGLIYGMGVGKMALKNDMSVADSKELKNAILALYPGLKDMQRDMKYRAQSGIPITTWGGREYYCEEPKIIKNRLQEFDYKMINQLVQGSAADCTKEAIIRYHKVKPAHHKFYLNVHDQLNSSVPKKEIKDGMELLREAMESVEFEVPMLSEGTWTATNWAEMKEYDKKGKLVYAN
jgi:DNA polymerase-1